MRCAAWSNEGSTALCRAPLTAGDLPLVPRLQFTEAGASPLRHTYFKHLMQTALNFPLSVCRCRSTSLRMAEDGGFLDGLVIGMLEQPALHDMFREPSDTLRQRSDDELRGYREGFTTCFVPIRALLIEISKPYRAHCASIRDAGFTSPALYLYTIK